MEFYEETLGEKGDLHPKFYKKTRILYITVDFEKYDKII